MQWMRCKVAEISVRHGEFGERIGKGKTVNFDRVVSKRKLETDEDGVGSKGDVVAITLGDLLKGREDCFEPGDAPQGEAPAAAPTALDVEDE